jgi:hypothetical protein
LDLILVNNPRTILLSEVGIPLLDKVRYHLPVIGVIDQPCQLNNSYKRKVYLYDRADFSSYREQLSQVNFDNLFASDDIDSITRSIVQILINEVDKAIPNRIITVRKDNPLVYMNYLIDMVDRLHQSQVNGIELDPVTEYLLLTTK